MVSRSAASAPRQPVRASRWLVATALALVAAPPAAAQQIDAPPCRRQLVQGRVRANEDFEASLSPTLVFRLDADTVAANPAGWTLRVTSPGAPDRDYAMVATPPYRFANPRYVDTGYGITAEAALSDTPRRFAFVGSDADFDRSSAALDVLLWSYSYTDAQVDSARAALDAVPVYEASFSIEDGEASAPTADHPLGRIEWMSFRLDACVPLA
ncbi:MAG: hypothetical protein AB7T31_10040 [Gemmatimonadales bacterium]